MRAENFQLAMIDFHERAWPGIECADFSFDDVGRLASNRCGHVCVRVWTRRLQTRSLAKVRGAFSFVEEQNRLSSTLRAQFAPACRARSRRSHSRDSQFFSEARYHRYQTFIHIHDGDPGFAIARRDRRLNWRRTAPTRQDRGVQIQACNLWNFEHLARKNLSVGHHDNHIRIQTRELPQSTPALLIRAGCKTGSSSSHPDVIATPL